jgi:hypothetical protein
MTIIMIVSPQILYGPLTNDLTTNGTLLHDKAFRMDNHLCANVD